ncbi:MAG: hypothetical protein RLZZ227_573 [Pseudomonadota bacterium]|jgi:hypothetical protein
MKFLHAVTLFATLGLALARDFFHTLGIHASYPVIGAFGLAMTTLLIFRGILPIIAVLILLAMVAMPDEALVELNLSHDLLLAAVLTIIVYPWIRRIALN